MKKFKKLIPALCMLLISAVLMGTSTYAWFSMNTTVTASGMQVTAKSDNVFLQISKTTEFTDPATEAKFTEKATALKPTTPAYASDKKSIEKWQYAYSTNPSDANVSASLTDIAQKDVGKYVYSTTLNVKIAAGSTATATNLVISGVSMTGATLDRNLNKALRVAVKGADGIQVYSYTTGEWAEDTTNSADALLASVTTTASEITIYIWFDGKDPECKTVNATSLDTLNFTINFSVTANAAD